MISNRTLGFVAGYGFVFTIASGIFFRNKIQDNFKKEEYYKNALKKLRQHRGAVHFMGEPIKGGRIDLANTEDNFADGLVARLAIPVKGPKKGGTLYMFAERQQYGEPYDIKRLELEFQDDKSKRLNVLK